MGFEGQDGRAESVVVELDHGAWVVVGMGVVGPVADRGGGEGGGGERDSWCGGGGGGSAGVGEREVVRGGGDGGKSVDRLWTAPGKGELEWRGRWFGYMEGGRGERERERDLNVERGEERGTGITRPLARLL